MFEAPGADTPDLGGGQDVSNATKNTLRHARDTPQNVSGRGYTFGMKENKERLGEKMKTNTNDKPMAFCEKHQKEFQDICGSCIGEFGYFD